MELAWKSGQEQTFSSSLMLTIFRHIQERVETYHTILLKLNAFRTVCGFWLYSMACICECNYIWNKGSSCTENQI